MYYGTSTASTASTKSQVNIAAWGIAVGRALHSSLVEGGGGMQASATVHLTGRETCLMFPHTHQTPHLPMYLPTTTTYRYNPLCTIATPRPGMENI